MSERGSGTRIAHVRAFDGYGRMAGVYNWKLMCSLCSVHDTVCCTILRGNSIVSSSKFRHILTEHLSNGPYCVRLRHACLRTSNSVAAAEKPRNKRKQYWHKLVSQTHACARALDNLTEMVECMKRRKCMPHKFHVRLAENCTCDPFCESASPLWYAFFLFLLYLLIAKN